MTASELAPTEPVRLPGLEEPISNGEPKAIGLFTETVVEE